MVAKYNKVTDEVVCATMERLVNCSMKPWPRSGRLLRGEDSRARSLSPRIGAHPYSTADSRIVATRAFTAEFQDIKLMKYRDPTFNIDQMQTAMRHLYLDDLSVAQRRREGEERSLAVA